MSELVYLKRDNCVKAVATESRKAELIERGFQVIENPNAEEKKKKSTAKSDKEGADGGQSSTPPEN